METRRQFPSRAGTAVHCPPNVPAKAVLPLPLGKRADGILLIDTNLLLADFGEAFAPALTVRPCEDSRSPLAARPSGARFEPLSPMSFSADIWCLGHAVWDLIAIRSLFGEEFVPPGGVVAQQVDVLGRMPPHWWENWEERSHFFDESGSSIQRESASPPLSQAFDDSAQKYRKKYKVGEFSAEEKKAFLDLLRRMLSFDPRSRPSAAQVLESEWMVNWAKPDFERSLQEL